MLDLRQNNEPVYYSADQLQRTHDNQLQNIGERHNQIQQLETDIVQLHEINRDFAELVSGHTQIIDNIEVSVVKAEIEVEVGNKSLNKAVGLKSAVRRKRILCGVVIFIILAIAAIITTVIVLTKKSK